MHPGLCNRITGDFICSTAVQAQGAAGTSAMEAIGQCCICTAFHGASKELCNALDVLTRCNRSTYVELSGLNAVLTCRLIPLDKNSRARPICICETVHCNMNQTILKVLKADIHFSCVLALMQGVKL